MRIFTATGISTSYLCSMNTYPRKQIEANGLNNDTKKAKINLASPHTSTGKQHWLDSDIRFNQLYPAPIQLLSQRHWTPLDVARKSADFLATGTNVKILDIGSGVGKFCLAAAYHKPKALYYGIEQRKDLVYYANAAKDILQLGNVTFMNGNFTQVNLRDYDHFYFYNAFYENLSGTDKIDNSIDYSLELYNYYNRYLYKQLELKPAGTRVASFYSLEDELPKGYLLVGSDMNDLLKFWIKL